VIVRDVDRVVPVGAFLSTTFIVVFGPHVSPETCSEREDERTELPPVTRCV